MSHPNQTDAARPVRAVRRTTAAILTPLACLLPAAGFADLASEVLGSWKLISHQSTFQGQTFDAHAALLQQRPCAAGIVYEIKADHSFRLNAAGSGCDDQFKRTQEKLYAKTQWKLEGDKFTTSATHFAVGQTYTVKVEGDRMTLVGTDGQGTLVYQRKP